MAKIDHLGIAVNSIQQARRLYEALGLTVLEQEEEDEGMRSVMIPVGESRLRLLEPLDKGTGLGKFLAQQGEGLHHLALHVDDISCIHRLPTACCWKSARIRLLGSESCS